MEVVTDLTFLDSKLHNEDHNSHGIKRHLLLGRKIMPELDKIWKTSDLGPSGVGKQVQDLKGPSGMGSGVEPVEP